MRLHTNIPTRGEVSRLFANNDPASVSIYLPTDPTSNGQAERIALKNLVSEATRQLEEAGIPKRDIADIEAHFEDLAGDGQFWKFQARTLAVFATPDSLVGYRLPNRLSEMVAVADRFHLKPLLRAITFRRRRCAALSQKSSRLFEVLRKGAPRRWICHLPRASRTPPASSTSTTGHPRENQSSAAEKSHLRIYSRTIDRVIRPSSRATSADPGAAEPLDSIYRSVNTYPHLAEKSIAGNPDGLSETEIASKAREILDDLYARQLADLHDLYEKRLRKVGPATTSPTSPAPPPTGWSTPCWSTSTPWSRASSTRTARWSSPRPTTGLHSGSSTRSHDGCGRAAARCSP